MTRGCRLAYLSRQNLSYPSPPHTQNTRMKSTRRRQSKTPRPKHQRGTNMRESCPYTPNRHSPPMVLSMSNPYFPFGLRVRCIRASCTPMSSALSADDRPPMFRYSKTANEPAPTRTRTVEGGRPGREVGWVGGMLTFFTRPSCVRPLVPRPPGDAG